MATARSAPRVVVPYRVRRVRALLVLCALGVGFVTVLGALSAPGPPRGPRPGPLRVAAASRLANPQPVGVPFNYGLPVVLNGGAAPVRIDRVLLVDPTRGLRLLRVYAGGPRRRYDSAVTDPSSGFPRRGSLFADLHPAPGYGVAPQRSTAGRRGIELVLVLRAPRRGRYGFRGLQVDSSQGTRRFRDVFPTAYVACAGPAKPESELPACPGAPRGVGSVRGG